MENDLVVCGIGIVPVLSPIAGRAVNLDVAGKGDTPDGDNGILYIRTAEGVQDPGSGNTYRSAVNCFQGTGTEVLVAPNVSEEPLVDVHVPQWNGNSLKGPQSSN